MLKIQSKLSRYTSMKEINREIEGNAGIIYMRVRQLSNIFAFFSDTSIEFD